MNVNHKARNVIFFAVVASMGSGCTKQDAAKLPVAATENRILTVDEYLKQPDLRKKVFAACANDPGRKGDDANCINATRAERIASAGIGRFPNLTP